MRSAELDILDTISLIYFIAFVVLLGLGFARMFYRLGLYLFARKKVPLLLRRDLALFGTWSIVFALILLFRGLGIQGLNRNPVWVIGSGAVALSGLVYWVYIEYFGMEG